MNRAGRRAADAALVLLVPAADPPERAAGILARHSERLGK